MRLIAAFTLLLTLAACSAEEWAKARRAAAGTAGTSYYPESRPGPPGRYQYSSGRTFP